MRVLVFVGAIIGAICLFASFFVAGAPQQAALAATACAFAIIPYVLFRLQSAATAEDQRKEIIELLRQKS
ncbi:hypothetical protein N5C12_10025 [Comamonas aquatica]|uniref:hypothetical protein n=1 Tax=Comamonas aquatica TaxID=225991 RepID=UPI002446ABA4|nr:hypothetical protein [Comamonas aquatica]MDH0899688.1 hypothetical protein [Comamonas aquatica]